MGGKRRPMAARSAAHRRRRWLGGWGGGLSPAARSSLLPRSSLRSSLAAPATPTHHTVSRCADYGCADYPGVQTPRPALAAAGASGRLDSKAQPARRRAPPCRAPPRAAPSASERACGWLTDCGWLRLRRPRTSENLRHRTRSRGEPPTFFSGGMASPSLNWGSIIWYDPPAAADASTTQLPPQFATKLVVVSNKYGRDTDARLADGQSPDSGTGPSPNPTCRPRHGASPIPKGAQGQRGVRRDAQKRRRGRTRAADDADRPAAKRRVTDEPEEGDRDRRSHGRTGTGGEASASASTAACEGMTHRQARRR